MPIAVGSNAPDFMLKASMGKGLKEATPSDNFGIRGQKDIHPFAAIAAAAAK